MMRPSLLLIRNRSLLACVSLALLASCTGEADRFTYEKPPAGVPDTPYWYPIGDSLFWFLPADSLALVQMAGGRTDQQKSAALLAVRELGWRMAVERSRALQRPLDPQELSQALFAVERVEGAATTLTHYGKFRGAFWNGTDTTLLGWLPGLVPSGQEGAQYFWPSSLVVVWKPGLRAAEVERLIDSLGFRIITPPGLTQQYWVQRAWAIELSAGSDLFTWLRWFNRDPRVHLAHPVLSQREPPVPDQRILRRFPPTPDTLIPAAFDKLSPSLKEAWFISWFCGHTRFVEQGSGALADGQRLRVRLKLSGDQEGFKDRLRQWGGEVIESKTREMELWIPFDRLANCAADPSVENIEEVRANLLGG